MASDKAGCVLRCWQIVLIVVGVIFLVLGIMSFVGISYGGTSGVDLALLIIGGLVFLVVGVFAFIVAAKGRQSRPLVICFMITMICFFFMALIMLVLGGLAYADCGNQNLPLHNAVCPTNNDRWKYFFALYVILIFTAIIGAAAAFSFWRLLRQEDEGGDKYVYLAEAAY